MATSEKPNRLLDFLGRRPNLIGSGLALAAVVAGEEPFHSRPVVLLPLAAVAYVSGYLIGGDYRADVNIQVESHTERVEIATIRDSIASLRQTMRKYQRRLPDDILAQVEELFGVLEEILPRWSKLSAFAEQKYTINAVLTDYLPKTLSNYLNLPASYYKRAAKHQYGSEVQVQLTILLDAVKKIRDGVYEGVESDIKAQTTFLQDRFTKEDGLRLS